MNVYIWTSGVLKNAYIGEYNPNKDKQWPCADGFHIPTKTEFDWLNTVITSLWISVSNVLDYLKIPLAWAIVNVSDWTSRIDSRWESALFWTSSFYQWDSSASWAYWYYFNFTYSVINITDYIVLRWYNIRPFKNDSVTPDSSWTALYSNKIYHNSSLWLISISSDWTNWITISDKNLWATSVYNNWDTMSETNCWKYYQWWNNYWFPFSWSVTVSTTIIDASTYWPWNYYSSSNFIVRQNPTAWDSSNNPNLWWWES